jgi:hypothetical protein
MKQSLVLVIGLDSKKRYHVVELRNPTRLVIDVNN